MRLGISVCAYHAGMRHRVGAGRHRADSRWSWTRRALLTATLSAGGCVAVGLAGGAAQAAEGDDPTGTGVSVERVVDAVGGDDGGTSERGGEDSSRGDSGEQPEERSSEPQESGSADRDEAPAERSADEVVDRAADEVTERVAALEAMTRFDASSVALRG